MGLHTVNPSASKSDHPPTGDVSKRVWMIHWILYLSIPLSTNSWFHIIRTLFEAYLVNSYSQLINHCYLDLYLSTYNIELNRAFVGTTDNEVEGVWKHFHDGQEVSHISFEEVFYCNRCKEFNFLHKKYNEICYNYKCSYIYKSFVLR